MKSGTLRLLGLFILFGAEFSAQCQKQYPQHKQELKIPVTYCISPVEVDLYNKINEYRKLYDLPPIPLSKSLSYVAKTHVRDLFLNRPDQGACNFHSWSDKGKWKPFCYPKDEKKNFSVWDKPKEITPYKSKGYEIVYWENNPVNIDSILPFWKSIDYFNSFLVYSGKWQGKKWLAIGVGIYENYAAVWFGEIPDPEGEPWICGREQEKKNSIGDSGADTLKTPAEPAGEPMKPETRVVTEASSGVYYIIISSQQPRAKSDQLAVHLVAKGFKDAKVLAKDNKVRVSIMEVNEKSKADSALREVKKIYKDAWIYKKTNP
jgi:hypothetical protein